MKPIIINVYYSLSASPPQFEVRPQSLVDLQVGSSVKLLCKVKGHPSPQITWSKVSNGNGNEESGYSKSGVEDAPKELIFRGSDEISVNGSTSILFLKVIRSLNRPIINEILLQ